MRVLSIGLISEGFGFAVFEGTDRLVDWGLRRADRAEDRSRATLERLEDLLEEWRPDVLVLEDCGAPGARRRGRICGLAREVEALARGRGCDVRSLPVRRVKGRVGAETKHEMAQAIAEAYPELEPRLPPEPKMWTGPDERQAIFDAAAMALVYLREEEPAERAA